MKEVLFELSVLASVEVLAGQNTDYFDLDYRITIQNLVIIGTDLDPHRTNFRALAFTMHS